MSNYLEFHNILKPGVQGVQEALYLLLPKSPKRPVMNYDVAYTDVVEVRIEI